MAETESESLQSSATQPTTESGGIAISEENLAALLGGDSKPRAPAVSIAPPAASAPPAPAPAEPPEKTLPLLASQAPATDVKEIATPAMAAAPATEHVGSTLALLHAIKENRAELKRSEGSNKAEPPAPPQAAAKVELPKAALPEKSLPEKIVAAVPGKPAPAASAGPAAPQRIAPAPENKSEKIQASIAPPVISAPTVTLPAKPAPRPSRAEQYAKIAESRETLLPAKSPVPGSFTAPEEPAAGLAGLLAKIPGGRVTVLIAGAVIAIAGVTTGLIVRSHRAAKPKAVAVAAQPAPAPVVNTFPLQLQVDQQASGLLNVRWNPQSTLLAQAKEGRLVITEGTQKPRTIPFGLDQLKIGHTVYQSQAERVEFRLEVVDQAGSVAEESVLALASAPAKAVVPVAVPVNPAATPAPQAEAPKPAEAQAPARTPVRTFTPPPTQRPAQASTLVEAPPTLPNGPIAVPGVIAQLPRAAAPPPPAPIQVQSGLQAANLIKRVTPAYPALAKSARVQGTVRFKATIAADGTVHDLEALAGPPMLRQAAADAVKQWIYRPTMLNGKPVEVNTQIEVNFTLSGQ